MAGPRRDALPDQDTPSPGSRWLVFALLVVASLANLPVVYALLASPDASPALVTAAGATAMGLAWAAGCSLAWRRRGSSVAIAALGVAEPALLLVPSVAPLVQGAAPYLVVASVAAAAALVLPVVRR